MSPILQIRGQRCQYYFKAYMVIGDFRKEFQHTPSREMLLDSFTLTGAASAFVRFRNTLWWWAEEQIRSFAPA
jgi:hypothetical protein